MNRNRNIVITITVILAAIISALSLFLFLENNIDDNNVKLKDNVNIITSETEKEFQPIDVTEDTISFENDPKYKVGDVIVAGIIDSAPNRFMHMDFVFQLNINMKKKSLFV